ncbi:transglutaminase family protein [Pseudokordiimonas caeni]|uniref:transglutaminase family protein n=1 Tax=Pseudokordiimonas caeni TaxID=2997908 RepID=UPI0028123E13|nr:transglutaminase family protein [Pseudokordiimonas caeni]
MRLKISHTTEYQYDSPVHFALQRLRLRPQSTPCQQVLDWKLTLEGATHEVAYVDHFGNSVDLISCVGESHMLCIHVAGEVETMDRAGVHGLHTGPVPLWLFEEPTELTTPGKGIQQLARGIAADDDVVRLHALMAAIRDRVAYVIGITHAATTAEEALAHGEGVCQDHSHLFITAARLLGFPARYVSGYLLLDDTEHQAASHAWAEAHVAGLGWVGFDVSNGMSPDDRYVRVAVGRDYADAAPVAGIRRGNAEESLAVSIRVEQ